MNLYIDQEKYNLKGKTPKEIIHEINSIIDEKAKILDCIECNEKKYYELEAIDWESSDSLLINIKTVTPVRLCLNTIEDANGYIDRLIGAFNEMITLYRDSKNKESGKILSSAVSGIEWINSVITKIEPVLGLDYQKLEVQGQKVIEYYGNYSSKLNELTEAIEAKDNFLAADIIEYEIIPFFKGWTEFFDNILKAFDNAN